VTHRPTAQQPEKEAIVLLEDTRTCKKCKVEKPIGSFPCRYRKNEDGVTVKMEGQRNWICHRCGHQATIRVWVTRTIKNLRSRHSRYGKQGPTFRRAEHLAEFDIDTDYVLEIYKQQDGLCAMTGMKMVHESHNIRSLSIDRIDNASRHVRGNIQLVCVWANLARGRCPVEEFLKVLNEFKQT